MALKHGIKHNKKPNFITKLILVFDFLLVRQRVPVNSHIFIQVITMNIA